MMFDLDKYSEEELWMLFFWKNYNVEDMHKFLADNLEKSSEVYVIHMRKAFEQALAYNEE